MSAAVDPSPTKPNRSPAKPPPTKTMTRLTSTSDHQHDRGEHVDRLALKEAAARPVELEHDVERAPRGLQRAGHAVEGEHDADRQRRRRRALGSGARSRSERSSGSTTEAGATSRR